ncbi:MAG TPA: hypothetical protein ENN40_09755 [Candidatus Aminicenantes bacterium]|nr:hypothetical protein [Candidatus Aminicenantes bacterium]
MKASIAITCLGLLLITGSLVSSAAPLPEKDDSLNPRRNLIICYEIKNYDSRIRSTVNTIFYDLIRPGDNLIVYSPARVYGFSEQTLSRPKAELSQWLQDKLKTDSNMAATGHRQAFNELKGLLEEMLFEAKGSDTKSLLNQYRQGLANLQSQRRINQPLLLQFADMFRKTPGENHVVVFFQKEFRPIPDSTMMDGFMQNVDLAFIAREIFLEPTQHENPKKLEAVIDAFRDAGVTLNFAYLQTGSERVPRRMELHEHSTDMYQFFSRLARETGGIILTTAKAQEMMKALQKRLKN